MADAAALLALFDAQRGRVPGGVAAGVAAERDGPVVRTAGRPRGGLVEHRDLGGLGSDRLDELIARQVRFFAERGEPFEWKLCGHDLPRDLPQRLRAAGLVPGPVDAVLVAASAGIAREPEPPAGVALREVSAHGDLARVAELEERVNGGSYDWLPGQLGAELASAPGALRVVVAEAAGEVVSAAWLRLAAGLPLARLHGGATLREWRGRGLYRALVARRAGIALAAGFPYLCVEASDDSGPILERLGFTAVTSTTPYRWEPPDRRGAARR